MDGLRGRGSSGVWHHGGLEDRRNRPWGLLPHSMRRRSQINGRVGEGRGKGIQKTAEEEGSLRRFRAALASPMGKPENPERTVLSMLWLWVQMLGINNSHSCDPGGGIGWLSSQLALYQTLTSECLFFVVACVVCMLSPCIRFIFGFPASYLSIISGIVFFAFRSFLFVVLKLVFVFYALVAAW